MQVQRIKIADIDRSKRLRAINKDWVQALADEAREAGEPQWSPIEVVRKEKGYRLIVGGHRTDAAELAGFDEIEAKVFEREEFASEDEITLREIRENLLRYGLTKLDRAIHLAAWQKIYETINPVNRRGGDRRSKAADQFPKSRELIFAERFSLAAAKVLGISETQISDALKIAKRISEPVRLRISAHWLADHASQLDKLAGETALRQEKIVDMLLAEPPTADSVAEAIAFIDRMPAPKQLELWERTYASLAKLPDPELDRVFDSMSPKIMSWLARNKGAKAA